MHAQPGARKPELRGMHGEAFKISIAEAAQDGKANKALVKALASVCGVPLSNVEVVAGHKSRRKRLFISGDVAQLQASLSEWLATVKG